MSDDPANPDVVKDPTTLEPVVPKTPIYKRTASGQGLELVKDQPDDPEDKPRHPWIIRHPRPEPLNVDSLPLANEFLKGGSFNPNTSNPDEHNKAMKGILKNGETSDEFKKYVKGLKSNDIREWAQGMFTQNTEHLKQTREQLNLSNTILYRLHDNLAAFTYNLNELKNLVPADLTADIDALKESLVKLIEKARTDTVFLMDINKFLARFNDTFKNGKLPENLAKAKRELDEAFAKDVPGAKAKLNEVYKFMFAKDLGGGKRNKSKKRRKTKKGGRKTRRRRNTRKSKRKSRRRKSRKRTKKR